VAKEKWSKALVDKNAFTVRRPIDSVELPNSKYRNEVSKGSLEAKKQNLLTNHERIQVNYDFNTVESCI
jgi:hypothetical protein